MRTSTAARHFLNGSSRRRTSRASCSAPTVAALAKPQEVSFDALAPNWKGLAAEYRSLAAAQGFDPTVEPTIAFDLFFGAGLSHFFATGVAPSPEYMRQIAEVVVEGLMARGLNLKRPGNPAASQVMRQGRPRVTS